MDVSVIIATRNRSNQLNRCLQAVRAIRSQVDWELVIVDNKSSDDTASCVSRFSVTAPMPVIYVLEEQPGLGAAHNAGVKAARGEILAFTDDDCYPAPDFVDRVRAAFKNDRAIGYVGGRIMLHDPEDLRLTVNESAIPLVFPARSYRQSGDVMGANMAFRRITLEQIGGFDPLFGPGALFNSEDTDAVARASAAGWSGRYCPDIIVSHHHGRRASDAREMWKSYSIGRGAYDMKHLLRGEFWWFLRSTYGLRNRYKLHAGLVFWEQVGKLMYLLVHTRRALERLIFRGGRRSLPRG